jgi:hypothetical protein
MYFERWGLLAPPLRKSELFKKNLLAHVSQQGYYTSRMTSVQLAAFRRAGVQEAIVLTIKSPDTLYYLDIINKSKI